MSPTSNAIPYNPVTDGLVTEMITLKRAADWLGINESRISKAISDGDLRAYTPVGVTTPRHYRPDKHKPYVLRGGKCIHIRVDDLRYWMLGV